MDNLNPIFKEISSLPVESKRQPNVKQKRVRKERSDKQHGCKFPINSILHMKLRRYCRQLSPIYQKKYNRPLSQTKFNTMLLRYTLKHIELVDWEKKYEDSKRYMHTSLLKSEFAEIGGPYGLSVQMGFSNRKTVFLMMEAGVRWLDRGGDLYEILQ